ncbi:MAG: hypothetical protein GF398_15115 [Chitinivibrionales bacterium]|nr:hypothetical protein [Chitinivibrionales bacterium]
MTLCGVGGIKKIDILDVSGRTRFSIPVAGKSETSGSGHIRVAGTSVPEHLVSSNIWVVRAKFSKGTVSRKLLTLR